MSLVQERLNQRRSSAAAATTTSSSFMSATSRRPSATRSFHVFTPTHPLVEALKNDLKKPSNFLFPNRAARQCRSHLGDLHKHVNSSRLARDDLAASGCIPVVLQAMKQHPRRELVLVICCDILVVFAESPTLTATLLECGGLGVLLDCLPHSSPLVRIRVCTVLRHLAKHSAEALLSEPKVLDAILQVLEFHLQNADVQTAACGVLLPLSLQEPCPEQLMDLDAIPAILVALQTHPDHVGLQTYACGIFLNWAAASGICRSQLLRQQGLLAILTAMRRHRRAAALQAYACGVLVHLLSTTASSEWESQAQGIVTVLVTALHTHKHDVVVQESACAALIHLLPHPDFYLTNGVPATLHILQAFPDNPDLQSCACAVLASAAYDDTKVQDDIRKHNGIHLVLTSMKQHLVDNTVQEQALRVLGVFNTAGGSVLASKTPEATPELNRPAERSIVATSDEMVPQQENTNDIPPKTAMADFPEDALSLPSRWTQPVAEALSEDYVHPATMEQFPEGAPLGSLLNRWSQPLASNFKIRGAGYLDDHKKVPSDNFLFPLRGVELFLAEYPPENIARNPALLSGKLRDVPTFVVNFRVPWGVVLCYCEIPKRFLPFLKARYESESGDVSLPSLDEMTPGDRTLARFLIGDDEHKKQTFKLVPMVVEGPWIVRSVVGGKPAIIGNKMPVHYRYQPEEPGGRHCYLEADVDIVSSLAARGILSVTHTYSQVLTIDLGFVIQGNEEDELPEQMLLGARLHGLDPDTGPFLPSSDESSTDNSS